MDSEQVNDLLPNERKNGTRTKTTKGDKENLHDSDTSDLHYGVTDNPPIHLAILFGFQIAIANICHCVNMAVLATQFICADQQFAGALFTTTSVMAGICTILQTTVGVRLPVFQGPSVLFALPYINAADDPAWGCHRMNKTDANITFVNPMSTFSQDKPWIPEWNKVQGSLMLASIVQIAIGMLGLGGVLLRLMGPISITCLIFLLGFSIQGLITAVAEIHWGMACLNIVIVIILSSYVNKIMVPMPTWSRKEGFKLTPFALFELFPILLSVIIGWIISYIFTVCGLFTNDPTIQSYNARTDFAGDSVKEAPVFSVPYPGQFGAPSFKASYTVMIAVVMFSCLLDSVGDYVQTTGPSKVPIPPPYAVNRGIIVEGIGCLLSGAMGAGHATTSYSSIIGMIGITKVASRRVFNISGVFMILMGICGKLGAVFVAIPKPVLAGPVFISISLLVGSGLSNLKEVNLWSTRTQAVLGIAIMCGVVIPTWLKENPDSINTGSAEVDQSIMAFLAMPLFVGTIVAIFLDLTVPGNSTRKMKSLTVTVRDGEGDDTVEEKKIPQDLTLYEVPYVERWLSRWRVTRYIGLPFLPGPVEPELGHHRDRKS